MLRLDTIKRQARKEAWYGDSWNPFRKTGRAKTWTPSSNDEEARISERDVQDSPLSTIQTEPTFHSKDYSNGSGSEGILAGSNGHTPEMDHNREPKDDELTTPAATTSNNKTRQAESEETAVERRSTRPRSNEEKARNRFIGKMFHKKGHSEKSSEAEDPEKKRPWYKGKVLPHKEPFTFRNQLQRTLFNSWVNILLLAAPVGLAVNYAGLDGKIVFCVNFIAIIPLAGLLSFATEEIALHVGESLGGLLNASFGYVLQFPLSIAYLQI